ncbi:MAG: hypothetical protein COT35_05975 [Nitrospirae bacterium CG08_land_8_20_14_0_20_52_24]|nr:MAG: hypothetical protein AUK29_08790 [Nitrospirae bacterium CG2_30_53_67]PIS37449.1 MAG: hypothetical protein COT35_05975 [Nitrospirae bacterium CG08_land_8_20_14_0_20_52_24]PIX86254.1 MAG: hypothetical protein COZ32_04280 [Nitrospirae bacterium CG_4_10_14_3_um_filter_53_41]
MICLKTFMNNVLLDIPAQEYIFVNPKVMTLHPHNGWYQEALQRGALTQNKLSGQPKRHAVPQQKS